MRIRNNIESENFLCSIHSQFSVGLTNAWIVNTTQYTCMDYPLGQVLKNLQVYLEES